MVKQKFFLLALTVINKYFLITQSTGNLFLFCAVQSLKKHAQSFFQVSREMSYNEKKNIVQRRSMNKIAVHNNKQQGELEKSVASVGNVKVKMHTLYRECISVAVNNFIRSFI